MYLTQLGYNVLYTDVDTVFLCNPIAHVRRRPEDVIASVDMTAWRQWKPYYCTVVMSLRSNAKPVELLQTWHKLTLKSRWSHYMNQPLFNMALCERGSTRLDSLSVGALDWIRFPPENVLKKRRFLRNATVIAHANFVKGISAKISLLKSVGAWHV